VTPRRNESQLCLELRSHNNADSSAPSPAATIAGIRQRLARQRDAESADIQREVEELLREWGEGSCDGQLSRLDLEAVRSAKKRSMLKEQNDMIVQLQSELGMLLCLCLVMLFCHLNLSTMFTLKSFGASWNFARLSGVRVPFSSIPSLRDWLRKKIHHKNSKLLWPCSKSTAPSLRFISFSLCFSK